MRTINEYECWLDTLDPKLVIRNHAIVSEFGQALQVPLAACNSEEEIVEWVVKLALSYETHPFGLPIKYLTERFIRLIFSAKKLPLDKEELMSKAYAAVESRHKIWLPPGQ